VTSEIKTYFKVILFIVLLAVFQPYFDLFLLYQYGPSAICYDCFIIEQTFYLSMVYVTLPTLVWYFILKKINVKPNYLYSSTGIVFSVLTFIYITCFLFEDRIAAWSTFSDSEIINSALLHSFPIIIIQIIIIYKALKKLNN